MYFLLGLIPLKLQIVEHSLSLVVSQYVANQTKELHNANSTEGQSGRGTRGWLDTSNPLLKKEFGGP